MIDIGRGLVNLFIRVIIIVFVITGGISLFIFKKNYIKTKARIEPELLLTTDGKKIDTIYIYRKQ